MITVKECAVSAADNQSPQRDCANAENAAPNRFGIASLLLCVAYCALLLALVVATDPLANDAGEQHFRALALDYLWLAAPFVGAALASALAWRSRFFSRWVFASILVLMLTSRALYRLGLLAVAGGQRMGESIQWELFGTPFVQGFEFLLLLGSGVLIRAIYSASQRAAHHKAAKQSFPADSR